MEKLKFLRKMSEILKLWQGLIHVIHFHEWIAYVLYRGMI